jgi:V8-like Glu-specific endopeptidase
VFHHRVSSACIVAVISTLMMPSVNAASPLDTANTASKPITLDMYDCGKVSVSSQTTHVGQVIKNVYREWIQTSQNDSAAITCITETIPTTKQLSKADAADLLADSSRIGARAVPESNTSKAAAVADESAKLNTVLPIGVHPGDPTVGKMAAPADALESSTSVPTIVARTAPQQLNAAGAPDSYAVLDLGYGAKPTKKEKALSTQIAKPAAAGTDDRSRVSDKSTPPLNLIGQLIVTWKDGTQTICTGTLVSRYVVLSAGQCAHNRDRGGFASKVSFAPAQGLVSPGVVVQPYGVRYADYVETNNRWTQLSGAQVVQTLDSRSDYAAFYFVQPWTYADTFMPVVFDDATVGIVNTAGYPTDAPGVTGFNQDMWYSSGTETSRSAAFLRAFQVREYSIDVSAGENGAPLWIFNGTNRSMTGVVSYGGDEITGGVWFGGENKPIVSGFIGWTPAQSGPIHVSDTLRVPIAVPSGDLSSDSYIRIYNPTPQGGTVTIMFADGDSGVTLGTWVSPTIPAFSEQQFEVRSMEPAASPPISPVGHERYTLSMNATFPGFFQHVLWNRAGISLTNVSGCGNGLSTDVLHLAGVHSSLFVDYPSVVFVHNSGTKAADAVIGVYNAADGRRLGGIVIPGIPANASAAFGTPEMENALGFKAVPGQFHYNLVQESDFPGYLQHLVYNTRAGLITNMTAKCAFPLR